MPSLIVAAAALGAVGWLTLAAGGGGSDTADDAYEWLGAWESIDVDGSSQWIYMGHNPDRDEYFSIYLDDRASGGSCPGAAVLAEGALMEDGLTAETFSIDWRILCGPTGHRPIPPLVFDQGEEDADGNSEFVERSSRIYFNPAGNGAEGAFSYDVSTGLLADGSGVIWERSTRDDLVVLHTDEGRFP